jgi:hypothetical protein
MKQSQGEKLHAIGFPKRLVVSSWHRPFADAAAPRLMLRPHQRVIVREVRRRTSQRQQQQQQQLLWPAASIAAMGVTYALMERAMYADYGTSMNQPSTVTMPAPPQAKITGRAYFEVAFDDNAIGRIVLGLHVVGTSIPL